MSLFGWLKHTLFGKAPMRDVSKLATQSNELDTLAETVDLSGGPLKPNHRRRALRDPRLLPKPPAKARLRHERKRVLTGHDAERWFSPTFLTRNRNLRDLLPDEEQLKRLGLPLWKSEAEIASALGITEGQLRYFAIHREKERTPHYVTFAIKKRSGGERIIMAPKRQLKAIQRMLLELLIEKLPVADCAHGFRQGRSIRSGSVPHVGRRVVLHMDLKDFFPTVTLARVRGYLIACGYGYPVATSLAVLMTEAQRQPVEVDGQIFHVPVGQRHCVQGAPTSPGICNALVLKLDRRLGGLARKFGVTYTRYADDLTFSGDIDGKSTGRFLHHAVAVIRAEGFEINAEKTRVMHRGGSQRVTGVTVNKVLGLSRKERRKLRAAVHHLVKDKPVDAGPVVRGRLAYLAMLNPEQAAPLLKQGDSVDWNAIAPQKQRPTPRKDKVAAGGAPAGQSPVVYGVKTPGSDSAPTALLGGRRFECFEDGAKKFWIVDVSGSELSVHFGRIGTRGQIKRKTYSSPEVAESEKEKLIRSKLAKGYTEKT